MQLRCLHATSFSFEVRDHDPDGDTRSGPSADLSGSIVVFVAVERADEGRAARVAGAAADRIAEMADRLGEEAVAVVPVAQLTDSPASKAAASEVVDALAARLDVETRTVPLGESISFELDARGHPFADRRFEIEPDERPDGEWFVVAANGSLAEADGEHPLLDERQEIAPLSTGQLADSTERGPALFDEHGAVLPAAVFLRDLVVDAVTDRLRAYGAFPVDNSTATGAASTATPANESLRSVFETASDGADGPELRTAVPIQSDALAETAEQIDLVSEFLADLSMSVEPVCRVSESFLDANRDWLTDLAGQFGSVLLERRAESDRPFRLEFVVFGEHSRLVAPAVWLDDRDGESDTATVVRSTPLDDPTRFVAALCRLRAESDRPQLPTWLAPIQFRLVPIEDSDIDACDRLAAQLESAGVRVDIDDRDLPVSERLSTASEQWIPYDAVVGTEDGETLRVTSRAEQTEREFPPERLAQRIGEESADRPTGPRPTPRRYSDRPDVLR
jgi:hypothetical protein